MKSKKVLICFLVAILVLSFVACSEEQHYHYFEEVSRTPATCTTAGEIVEKCSCGEERKTEIPPLGHNYEEIATTATCTEGGISTMKCQLCNDTYDESIETLGHSYASGGYCSRCEKFRYDIKLSKGIPCNLYEYYYSGGLYSGIKLTYVKLVISGSYLYFTYSGEKIYDTNGNTHVGSTDFVCILKDSDTGEIIASKTVYSPSLVVGQRFTNTSTSITYASYLSENKKYVLELLNKN